MTTAFSAAFTQEVPLASIDPKLRLAQVLEDCHIKGLELIDSIGSPNPNIEGLQTWDPVVSASKELLQLLRTLEEVNKFVISKDALKPEQKSYVNALNSALNSVCHLYDASQHSQSISKGIFDSSLAALRTSGMFLSRLLEDFAPRLAVNEGY